LLCSNDNQQERDSWHLTAFCAVGMIVIAWIVSCIVYQGGLMSFLFCLVAVGTWKTTNGATADYTKIKSMRYKLFDDGIA